MTSKTILRALLKESISTESCGIVTLYDDMPTGDFMRQYFDADFSDPTIDGFRFISPKGEYFYVWHNAEIDFGFGQGYQMYYKDQQVLHICPLSDDEESEED